MTKYSTPEDRERIRKSVIRAGRPTPAERERIQQNVLAGGGLTPAERDRIRQSVLAGSKPEQDERERIRQSVIIGSRLAREDGGDLFFDEQATNNPFDWEWFTELSLLSEVDLYKAHNRLEVNPYGTAAPDWIGRCEIHRVIASDVDEYYIVDYIYSDDVKSLAAWQRYKESRYAAKDPAIEPASIAEQDRRELEIGTQLGIYDRLTGPGGSVEAIGCESVHYGKPPLLAARSISPNDSYRNRLKTMLGNLYQRFL